MSIRLFIISFFCLGLSFLWSQAEAPKLSKAQLAQLKSYQQITQLVRQGKTDQKKFFAVYYKPIAESTLEMEPLYRKEGLKLQDRADQALESQKMDLAKRLNQAARVYLDLADTCKKISESYEKSDVGEIKSQLNNYLGLEKTLKEMKAKPLRREWFTTKEAEQMLRLIAKRK